MKYLVILIAALSVMGCGGDSSRLPQSDNCLRAEIFKQCLQSTPAGPTVAGGENPWNKVIDACENAAYYQSKRQPNMIKPECRSF